MFKAIYELFFGKRFEFHSPYNMDQAIYRLEKYYRDDVMLPNLKRFKIRRWYLQIRENPYKWGDYNFLCRPRWGFRRTNYTIARGQLQPDDNGVCVTGIIRFDRLSSVLIWGLPISLPIILWLNPSLFPLLLIIVTVSMIDGVVSRIIVGKQLYQVITSTLGEA